jgi:hypothetical protein
MLSLESRNILLGRLYDVESLLQGVLEGDCAVHSNTCEVCHFFTLAKEGSKFIDGFIHAEGRVHIKTHKLHRTQFFLVRWSGLGLIYVRNGRRLAMH